MYLLRRSWHQGIQKGIDYLKTIDHPLARKALKLIESKKVKLLSFNAMTKLDMEDSIKGLQLSKKRRYQRNEHTAKCEAAYDGYTIDDRIYIRGSIADPRQVAVVLLHELNHYIEDDEKKDVFDREMKSFLTELIIYSKRITPSRVNVMARMVSKNYGVDMPKTFEHEGKLYKLSI